MQDDQDRSFLRLVQYYYFDGYFELIFGVLCLTLRNNLRENPRLGEVQDGV